MLPQSDHHLLLQVWLKGAKHSNEVGPGHDEARDSSAASLAKALEKLVGALSRPPHCTSDTLHHAQDLVCPFALDQWHWCHTSVEAEGGGIQLLIHRKGSARIGELERSSQRRGRAATPGGCQDGPVVLMSLLGRLSLKLLHLLLQHPQVFQLLMQRSQVPRANLSACSSGNWQNLCCNCR